jgi:hypothetical protein
MNAQQMLDGFKGEGAKRNWAVKALLEDGRTADIMMVEAEADIIYLKLEVSE